MTLRLFLIAAIVLSVFAIIASAQASLELFSVTWITWICAAALAYLVDVLFNGWGVDTGTRQAPPQ